MDNTTEIYQIKLPQFEGPFDLLLYFIQRDELDIYDIAITKLTEDFLAYIHEMEILNIELASEFILIAASLMRIKAKMLLPRKELDADGEEIDPRKELVQRLLEYKRFKEVVETLKVLEAERAQRFTRGNAQRENKYISEKYGADAELESLNLYRLFNVFQKVLDRYEDRQKKLLYSVVKQPYTVRLEKKYLKDFLKKHKEGAFVAIFEDCKSRIQAVFRFLAILELMQEQVCALRLGLGFNNFWIEKVS